MTTPANNTDKPSPSDTSTARPDDNGHKSIVRKEDEQYNEDDVDFGNVNKQHREEEQPVNPITTPPTEQKGQEEGKVQP